MGSCCFKGETYVGSRGAEPSAWQLATADDFYDSENAEGHADLTVIDLQPGSYHASSAEHPRALEHHSLNQADDDDQVVSLDFNLAPKPVLAVRPISLLRPHSTSNGKLHDSSERPIVLPGLENRNELRGSGSFSISVRNSGPLSGSGFTAIGTDNHVETDEETEQYNLAESVIRHNTDTAYSYSSQVDQTLESTGAEHGVLSGEDDEDSVASPLVLTSAATHPHTTPASPAKTLPSGSPSKISRKQADAEYLALKLGEDSTLYEDAVSHTESLADLT